MTNSYLDSSNNFDSFNDQSELQRVECVQIGLREMLTPNSMSRMNWSTSLVDFTCLAGSTRLWLLFKWSTYAYFYVFWTNLERRRDFPVMTKPNGVSWRFLVLLSSCLTLTCFTCSALGTRKVDWHVIPVISTFYTLFDSIYAPFLGWVYTRKWRLQCPRVVIQFLFRNSSLGKFRRVYLEDAPCFVN